MNNKYSTRPRHYGAAVGLLRCMGFALVLTGFFFACKGGETSRPFQGELPTAGIKMPDSVKIDYLRGKEGVPITIIEYADFECGFCAKHSVVSDQLLREYGHKVNIVFRHYPLRRHTHAQLAAEACECAGELGGPRMFWKYHDLLFSEGPENSELVAYAELLGLDSQKFKQCLQSGRYAGKIKAQRDLGEKAGIKGTPYILLLNNKTGVLKALPRVFPLEDMKKIIDQELKSTNV